MVAGAVVIVILVLYVGGIGSRRHGNYIIWSASSVGIISEYTDQV